MIIIFLRIYARIDTDVVKNIFVDAKRCRRQYFLLLLTLLVYFVNKHITGYEVVSPNLLKNHKIRFTKKKTFLRNILIIVLIKTNLNF